MEQGRRILIGVASWFLADMRLLDALNDAVQGQAGNDTVDVFSIQEVYGGRDLRDADHLLQEYLPGVNKGGGPRLLACGRMAP